VDWRLTHDAEGAWNGVFPHQLDELTMSELALLLDEGKPRTKSGRPAVMSDEEITAYARWYYGLGCEEKLRLAEEGKL